MFFQTSTFEKQPFAIYIGLQIQYNYKTSWQLITTYWELNNTAHTATRPFFAIHFQTHSSTTAIHCKNTTDHLVRRTFKWQRQWPPGREKKRAHIFLLHFHSYRGHTIKRDSWLDDRHAKWVIWNFQYFNNVSRYHGKHSLQVCHLNILLLFVLCYGSGPGT